MAKRERCEQIQRMFRQERRTVSVIAQELGVDRKAGTALHPQHLPAAVSMGGIG